MDFSISFRITTAWGKLHFCQLLRFSTGSTSARLAFCSIPLASPAISASGHSISTPTQFVEFLAAAGFRYWQVCPLGPTGYGDSPYQCFSAFAGNPYLIDLGALVRAGLIADNALGPLLFLNSDRVDYGALWRLKWPILFKPTKLSAADAAPRLMATLRHFSKNTRTGCPPTACFKR